MPADFKGRSVLVVDDDPDILSAVQTAFTHNGASVRTANDGNKAVDMARSLNPDLIILDKNPLDDIRNTTAIHTVVANGRLFGGQTMAADGYPAPKFYWQADAASPGAAPTRTWAVNCD